MAKIFLLVTGLAFTAACSGTENPQTDNQTSQITTPDSSQSASTPTVIPVQDCSAAETLLYQMEGFSSFTEDKMRGTGVVSIQLEVNDRLDIYDLDDIPFGFLVYNEDHTFYTLDMPQKVVARGLVPEADVAQFDFDAEAPDTDPQFLYVYVNKAKRKIAKADLTYTFSP